jgi:hypothetical protein
MEIAEGYERLRAEVLTGRVAQCRGLGILLKGGLAAWMEASTRFEAPGTGPSQGASGDLALPEGLLGEVVTLLAAMVLSPRKELLA